MHSFCCQQSSMPGAESCCWHAKGCLYQATRWSASLRIGPFLALLMLEPTSPGMFCKSMSVHLRFKIDLRKCILLQARQQVIGPIKWANQCLFSIWLSKVDLERL